jgi:hypothetical protein
MAKKQFRFKYKQIEPILTYILMGVGVIFLLYLIFAAINFVAGKVICAILGILISGLVLAYLYMSKELLRRRSIWMTLGAGSVVILTLMSLILNFPAPFV